VRPAARLRPSGRLRPDFGPASRQAQANRQGSKHQETRGDGTAYIEEGGTDEVEFVVENAPQLRLFLVGVFQKLGPVDGLGVTVWTAHAAEQLVLVYLAHLLRPLRLGRRVVFRRRCAACAPAVGRVRWQGPP